MDRRIKAEIEKILFNGSYKKIINSPDVFMDKIVYKNMYPDINSFSIDINAKCILARSFALFFLIKKDGKNIDGKSNDDLNTLILNSFANEYNFIDLTNKRYNGNYLTNLYIKNIEFNDKDLHIKLIKIACAYMIDGLLAHFENNTNQAWFFLSQANYYLGMMQGITTRQLEIAINSEIANRPRIEQLAMIKSENLKVVRDIYNSKTWHTYTACATHIFDNKLLPYNKGYRAIEALVREVANE